MKKLVVIFALLTSSQSFARGVLVQCWEKGVSQSPENIIYQNNGGYIHEDFVVFDGVKMEITQSQSQCIDWDFPTPCKDVITRENGDEITLELEKAFSFANGGEALDGVLYEVEMTPVFCKRHAL